MMLLTDPHLLLCNSSTSSSPRSFQSSPLSSNRSTESVLKAVAESKEEDEEETESGDGLQENAEGEFLQLSELVKLVHKTTAR